MQGQDFSPKWTNRSLRRSRERARRTYIIASLLPYERYVSAETVLRMAQVPGTLGNQFRSTEKARTALDDLRRAQAEAEVRCY